jgi:uncharacterized protein (TIGR02058 family)
MRQVLFVELGMGVDLRGVDPTKAAVRAVRDAIGRNTIPGMAGLLEGGGKKMSVLVRLAAPAEAGPIDAAAVAASLPHGEARVEIAPGGLLAPNGVAGGGNLCVVNAAVEVAIESA